MKREYKKPEAKTFHIQLTHMIALSQQSTPADDSEVLSRELDDIFDDM